MNDALTVGGNGELKLGKFTLSVAGIAVTGSPRFDEWATTYAVVERIESGVMWWLGDLLNYGENAYGEAFSQVLNASGYREGTLRNAKWVAASVPASRRREAIPFSLHQEVASLTPAKQDEYLDKAANEGLTRAELRRAIHASGDVAPLTAGEALRQFSEFTEALLSRLPEASRRVACVSFVERLEKIKDNYHA